MAANDPPYDRDGILQAIAVQSAELQGVIGALLPADRIALLTITGMCLPAILDTLGVLEARAEIIREESNPSGAH
jgi:hypothetical protein